MFIATFVIYTVDECGRNAIRNKLVQNRKLNVTFAILLFSLYLTLWSTLTLHHH